MRKFPLYAQHEMSDCGPACLKMIAAYYGKSCSLGDLRDMCCISRNGVSLRGISEAAEKIGFNTVGVQFSLKQLVKEMTSPCILHWNQMHFVVLYKIQKKKEGYIFHIADPVGTKAIYTETEFTRCWYSSQVRGEETGVLLSLVPAPSFYEKQEGESKTTQHNLLFLSSYLRPYNRDLKGKGSIIVGRVYLGERILKSFRSLIHIYSYGIAVSC